MKADKQEQPLLTCPLCGGDTLTCDAQDVATIQLYADMSFTLIDLYHGDIATDETLDCVDCGHQLRRDWVSGGTYTLVEA